MFESTGKIFWGWLRRRLGSWNSIGGHAGRTVVSSAGGCRISQSGSRIACWHMNLTTWGPQPRTRILAGGRADWRQRQEAPRTKALEIYWRCAAMESRCAKRTGGGPKGQDAADGQGEKVQKASGKTGRRGGTRTRGHRIKSPMLYHLSYPPMKSRGKRQALARTVFRRVECEGLAVNCGPSVRESHCFHWEVYGIAASGVKRACLTHDRRVTGAMSSPTGIHAKNPDWARQNEAARGDARPPKHQAFGDHAASTEPRPARYKPYPAASCARAGQAGIRIEFFKATRDF